MHCTLDRNPLYPVTFLFFNGKSRLQCLMKSAADKGEALSAACHAGAHQCCFVVMIFEWGKFAADAVAGIKSAYAHLLRFELQYRTHFAYIIAVHHTQVPVSLKFGEIGG